MSTKRKREDQEELEVDVNAPEPPSRKAQRQAKKGKAPRTKDETDDKGATSAAKPLATQQDVDAARRDAPGIWIGNLPWTVTKDDLLQFLIGQSNGSISATSITRVNMPGPTPAALGAPSAKFRKPVNRGFAHVDFSTAASRDAAIALSEKLLSGRAVLIKNSKSFEGRPDTANKEQQASGKPPNKKIFVGNLGFETTEEQLMEHFSKCGEVKTAFMAKFHDTNKCKGYAWITFTELSSAEKAIRGWVEIEPEDTNDDDDDAGADTDVVDGIDDNATAAPETEGDSTLTRNAKSKTKPKKPKPRKWFINRMKGRDLRMEYAEDATTRYNKRFGKGANKNNTGQSEVDTDADEALKLDIPAAGETQDRGIRQRERPRGDKAVKPSQALPSADNHAQSKDKAYLTGAVMEGKGKKVTFD